MIVNAIDNKLYSYPLDGVQFDSNVNLRPSTFFGSKFNSAFKSAVVLQISVKVNP